MPQPTNFLGGTLRIWQRQRGYRFSLDAPILADFLECAPHDTLLEIGTGSGVIPLVLLRTKPFGVVHTVEIQPGLAELARRNVEENGGEGRIVVHHGDIRTMGTPPLPLRADVVFSNPPYRRVGHGKLNPDPEKATARHELTLTAEELLDAADRFLAPTGRLFLIHLPERERDVAEAAARRGLHLQVRRQVRSFPEDPDPRMVLLRFGREPIPLLEPSPLVVFLRKSTYTPEFNRIISPSPSGP